MKFLIVKVKRKSGPQFKIQLRSYRKSDIERINGLYSTSTAITKAVPKSEWARYGFHEAMSYEEAVERKTQLNAQRKLEDEKNARFALLKRQQQEQEIECAYLPPSMIQKFEEKLRRDFLGTEEEFRRSKTSSYWRAAKRVIRSLSIDPSDWEEEKRSFYHEFMRRYWSVSYCEKIILVLNKWGHFQSKQLKSYFKSLPLPRGREREIIADNHREQNFTKKESAPLRINDLEKARINLQIEHYNWLYISLWFGLRPEEGDNLNQGLRGTNWDIEERDGYTILSVYQTKLTAIEHHKRWKYIPCIFEEQERAIELILAGDFRRPLVKTIRFHVGADYTAYGGRKGFESLLLDRGVEFNLISSYMGHSTVDRTWRNYRDRKKVHIPKKYLKEKEAS